MLNNLQPHADDPLRWQRLQRTIEDLTCRPKKGHVDKQNREFAPSTLRGAARYLRPYRQDDVTHELLHTALEYECGTLVGSIRKTAWYDQAKLRCTGRAHSTIHEANSTNTALPTEGNIDQTTTGDLIPSHDGER